MHTPLLTTRAPPPCVLRTPPTANRTVWWTWPSLDPAAPLAQVRARRALLWWLLWWLLEAPASRVGHAATQCPAHITTQLAGWSLHGLLADFKSASSADDVSTQERLRAPSLKTPPPNAILACTTNLPTPASPPPTTNTYTHTHTHTHTGAIINETAAGMGLTGQGAAGTGHHHHTHGTGVTDTRL
jgi:hypothetical protein